MQTCDEELLGTGDDQVVKKKKNGGWLRDCAWASRQIKTTSLACFVVMKKKNNNIIIINTVNTFDHSTSSIPSFLLRARHFLLINTSGIGAVSISFSLA